MLKRFFVFIQNISFLQNLPDTHSSKIISSFGPHCFHSSLLLFYLSYHIAIIYVLDPLLGVQDMTYDILIFASSFLASCLAHIGHLWFVKYIYNCCVKKAHCRRMQTISKNNSIKTKPSHQFMTMGNKHLFPASGIEIRKTNLLQML